MKRLLSLLLFIIIITGIGTGFGMMPPPVSHAITVPTPTAQPLTLPPTPEPANRLFPPIPQVPPAGTQRQSLREQIRQGELLLESEHFVYYDNGGALPDDITAFANRAEAAYDYVQTQMRVDSDVMMIVGFRQPSDDPCRARGLASDGAFLFFSDEDFTEAQYLGILAHETAHVLHLAEGDPVMPRNNALTEGFATWAAREYQVAWYGETSLDQMVRDYLTAGVYQPLTETWQLQGIYPGQGDDTTGDSCLQQRDQLYTQWGSFVGYLVETYGLDSLYALFERNRTGDQRPDYFGTYGLALNQLEAAWLRHLHRTDPPGS